MRGSIRSDGATNAIRRPRYFLNTDRRACRFLAGGNGNDLVAWCYQQRRAVSRYLSIGITDFPQHVGLLNALILGYRQDLPPDMKTDFAWTGTLHIIAISGSHIVVIAGILLFILQMCGISRMHWAYFLAPLLVIYTVAIGMPASAVRATVMAIIYYSAPVLRRKADTLSALALAAILILTVTPGQLFDLGFILSFAAVLGLIVLCPIIDQPLQKLLDPDPLRLQALPERVEIARSAGRYVLSLITLAVSAWLVSTPLTAYFFQRFSLVALPANILVIPLAFFIILSACLSLMLGPLLGLFADIFNHANLVLITIFVRAMGWMADIPGGSFVVPRPPIWSLVLWYLFLAAVAFLIRTRRKPAKPTM
jgi:competence protein ComEC